MQKSMRYYISGKVQGVWFRAFTKEQAEKLGVTGYVRNLPDGRVEAVVCGEEELLSSLLKLLYEGPPKAEVEQIVCEELPWESYREFEVRT